MEKYNSGRKNGERDRRVLLSSLWIFVMFNYLYCDVVSLMDCNLLSQYLKGTVNGMQLTQVFLLGGAILMEIPIALIVLSRILKHTANRWVNMIGSALMTVVQLASLFAGKPAVYYLFFSIIEISCTVIIFIIALGWSKAEA